MIEHVARFVLPAAFSMLPPSMNTIEARAMLLAIGLQESKFLHRVQMGGPARGFWQFERGGGVVGVMAHPASRAHSARVCAELRYHRASPDHVYTVLAHNDTLSACFARLLLWTDPGRLPGPDDPSTAWAIYLRTWRPGKPHESTWAEHYRHGWTVAQGDAQ